MFGRGDSTRVGIVVSGRLGLDTPRGAGVPASVAIDTRFFGTATALSSSALKYPSSEGANNSEIGVFKKSLSVSLNVLVNPLPN